MTRTVEQGDSVATRHAFHLRTRRLIASRVAGRCSNPDCRRSTNGPSDDLEDATSIGVAAHIAAASPGGPRYDSAMTERARRAVTNGIWLCASCARMIDADCARFTVSVLRFWRSDAEDRARCDLEQPTSLPEAVRFASIVLEPNCLWARSHRLGKVAAKLNAQPEFGFHAIPESAWAERGMSLVTHSSDPIFDLTLVNDAATTSVLSAVGIEVHSIWSDLKALPQAYKIAVVGEYVLRLEPMVAGSLQRLQLPDPVAVPAGMPARLTLTLAGFGANLPGNESLVRFVVVANGTLFRSRLINLGVY